MANRDERGDALRVLVVTAHPDDVDFGAAGTIAVWVSQGAEVAYCIITDGEAGGFDPTITRTAMAEIRRAEQRRAAARVGVSEVEFLAHRDGRVLADLDLRRDICRVIRRHRPDRIVCQSPDRDYSRLAASHPDHLAAGEATLCAVYPDARNPFAFPELLSEGLEPHSVNDVWLAGGPHNETFVDITDFVDQKIAAILDHKSQFASPTNIAERVRGWTASTAARAGLGDGHFAESFQVIAI